MTGYVARIANAGHLESAFRQSIDFFAGLMAYTLSDYDLDILRKLASSETVSLLTSDTWSTLQASSATS
ncbi:MAG: hypothetical protein K2X72_07655 [Reyranella sp.]|nr:hypothetical protein [Reyranella sp.]